MDNVSEGDFKRLQPLLWLELASLFDKNHVALDKRKPFKRKRKEEGNVFGVSLNALVRRDQQITGEDTTLVPLILQAILSELRLRGAKEEGILRVPGHKQKVRSRRRHKARSYAVYQTFKSFPTDRNPLQRNRTQLLLQTGESGTLDQEGRRARSQRTAEAMAARTTSTPAGKRSCAFILPNER